MAQLVPALPKKWPEASILALTCCLVWPVPTAAADLVQAFASDRQGAGPAALSLARAAFDAYALRRERLSVPENLPPLLRQRGGVFVSAVAKGAPRCCMGSLYPTRANLAEEIVAAAVAAAGLDARRAPVKPAELPRLQLVVSIVSPPEGITDPAVLDPVTEGLAVRSARRTGVVLPGETTHLDRMIKWARIRAGAEPDEEVDYFRVRAFRIAEPNPAAREGVGEG
ncbi:MAG: AMMECR1 domain-containing protein [Armatimonadota bacterium]